MIKVKEENRGPLEIDLTGPDGNAWNLIGIASKFARALDLEWEPIREDMMSSDYEHLLEVMEEHFGDFIIMYR